MGREGKKREKLSVVSKSTLKKHKKMPLKKLLEKLSQDAEVKASFDASRLREIHITKKRIRALRAQFGRNVTGDDLDTDESRSVMRQTRELLESSESEPQEMAHINESKRKTHARRGQWVRLDIYKERNGGKEPGKGQIHWRVGKGCTSKAQWVKVYKDVVGVEDFSSASDEELTHRRVLDSGRGVLDEDQVRFKRQK